MAEPTGRPTGRPKLNQRPILESDYPEIYRLWLRGAGTRFIGEKYGVTHSTIAQHLSRIRSSMRMNMLRERNEVLAELADVRFSAWQSYSKSQTPVKMDEIRQGVEAAAANASEAGKAATANIVRSVTKIISKHGGDATWLYVIIAAIAEECRLSGIYEASKMEATMRRPQIDELRVAGSTPEEVWDLVGKRLIEVLQRKREALAGGAN